MCGGPSPMPTLVPYPDDPEPVRLTPVDRVTVTTLADNVVDMTMPGSQNVRRQAVSARQTPSAVLDGGVASVPLTADPGFSALVTVERDGHTVSVLYDAGMAPRAAADNMRLLEVPADDIAAIVVSHGHFDHVTGLEGIASLLGGHRSLPLVVHPGVWARRRLVVEGADPFEMHPPSRRALTEAGFEIIERRVPSLLLDGSVLVTGEVRRTTGFERGFPVHQAFDGSAWVPDPLLLDDQAVVVNVRDRGLVVISGCGHAGMVNTVGAARALTGVSAVAAVIGGFHLSGPLFAHAVAPTCEALAAYDPALVVPGHCTGWPARAALAETFGDRFMGNAVGTSVVV